MTKSHEDPNPSSGTTSGPSNTKYPVAQSLIELLLADTTSDTPISAIKALLLGQIAESVLTIATKCGAPCACCSRAPGTCEAETSRGAISAVGRRLAVYLDGLHVETRWLKARTLSSWVTGLTDDCGEHLPADHTHCSAFVAAAAHGINVYILRPPEHSQVGLANAQVDWLNGRGNHSRTSASDAGWRPLGHCDAELLDKAVAFANAGRLVVAGYKQPPLTDLTGKEIHAPGHVVIVRPQAGAISRDQGPQVIMAGAENWQSISMLEAFKHHPAAWPNNIQLFVHDAVLV